MENDKVPTCIFSLITQKVTAIFQKKSPAAGSYVSALRRDIGLYVFVTHCRAFVCEEVVSDEPGMYSVVAEEQVVKKVDVVACIKQVEFAPGSCIFGSSSSVFFICLHNIFLSFFLMFLLLISLF